MLTCFLPGYPSLKDTSLSSTEDRLEQSAQIHHVVNVLSVTAFGTLSLSFVHTQDLERAHHVFTVVMFAFASTSLLATVAATLSIQGATPGGPEPAAVVKDSAQPVETS